MGDIHVERRKKVDPRFSSGIRQVLPACFRLALRQLNLVCNGAALPPRVSMLSCHQGMKVAPAIFGDTQPLEQAVPSWCPVQGELGWRNVSRVNLEKSYGKWPI